MKKAIKSSKLVVIVCSAIVVIGVACVLSSGKPNRQVNVIRFVSDNHTELSESYSGLRKGDTVIDHYKLITDGNKTNHVPVYAIIDSICTR